VLVLTVDNALHEIPWQQVEKANIAF
jgi:hypothetical protein